MMIVCDACRGQKTLMTTGMMSRRNCETCKGVGKIEDKEMVLLEKPEEKSESHEEHLKREQETPQKEVRYEAKKKKDR